MRQDEKSENYPLRLDKVVRLRLGASPEQVGLAIRVGAGRFVIV
jgi:hypothetical protein